MNIVIFTYSRNVFFWSEGQDAYFFRSLASER
jgi:hypothetical protein